MQSDEVRVRLRDVGVCGTDLEILNGAYGTAPEGEDHLIIGHESLGQVEDVGSELKSCQSEIGSSPWFGVPTRIHAGTARRASGTCA